MRKNTKYHSCSSNTTTKQKGIYTYVYFFQEIYSLIKLTNLSYVKSGNLKDKEDLLKIEIRKLMNNILESKCDINEEHYNCEYEKLIEKQKENIIRNKRKDNLEYLEELKSQESYLKYENMAQRNSFVTLQNKLISEAFKR